VCKRCPGTLLGVLLLFEIFAILPVAVATAERSFLHDEKNKNNALK